MLRLAFDFIITWRETRTRPNAYFRFSPEMCKRRGGWKYAYVEMRFQRQLQKLGYIGILMMMTNICIRLVTRLVPNSLRGWIYKKFLRK